MTNAACSVSALPGKSASGANQPSAKTGKEDLFCVLLDALAQTGSTSSPAVPLSESANQPASSGGLLLVGKTKVKGDTLDSATGDGAKGKKDTSAGIESLCLPVVAPPVSSVPLKVDQSSSLSTNALSSVAGDLTRGDTAASGALKTLLKESVLPGSGPVTAQTDSSGDLNTAEAGASSDVTARSGKSGASLILQDATAAGEGPPGNDPVAALPFAAGETVSGKITVGQSAASPPLAGEPQAVLPSGPAAESTTAGKVYVLRAAQSPLTASTGALPSAAPLDGKPSPAASGSTFTPSTAGDIKGTLVSMPVVKSSGQNSHNGGTGLLPKGSQAAFPAPGGITGQVQTGTDSQKVPLPGLEQQVTNMVLNYLNQKSGHLPASLQLQLDPPALGQLTIHLTMADGALSLTFLTASAHARDLVAASMPQLRDNLAQHNFNLGETSVYVGSQTGGGQSRGDTYQNAGWTWSGSIPPALGLKENAGVRPEAPGHMSLVNILV